MEQNVYTVDKDGYLNRNGKHLQCPFLSTLVGGINLHPCGIWCALFEVQKGTLGAALDYKTAVLHCANGKAYSLDLKGTSA